MKKYIIAGTIICFTACNSNTANTADPVERADSINEAQRDMVADDTDVLESASSFLVKAADGGLAEVAAGKIAADKSVNKDVKDFAKEMIRDHEAMNNDVQSLAKKLNITLPASYSEDHQKKIAELGGKTAKEFDKDFIDMMVADHKKMIELFRDASDDNLDPGVRAFVIATVPALEAHLAKAELIQKTLQ